MEIPSEADNLKQAIQALESQRQTLGDAVVEAALAPLREKLATLQAGALREQRKLVSVLFADLVGFTSLASSLDPEELREILNAYFQRWSDCITHQGGVIEKYIGDAVLAVFGLPIAHEDDSERAIRAALDMQKELLELNKLLDAKHGLRLSMRVGINTGAVLVSLLGERQGEGLVVVGEMVNLASRLQTAAPVDGILISHDTYRHVRGLFEVSPFGPLQLKGIDNPIQAYWVRAAKPRSFRLGSRGVEGVETPMVGRQEEFQHMKDVFLQVLEEKERLSITLVGEAGLGKSRLLYEFENWLELRPERVNYFRGRAYLSTQHVPYSLIRDVFAFRCQIQDSDSPVEVREKLEQNAGQVLGGEDAGRMKAHFIGRLLGFEIGESEHLRAVAADAKSLHDRALVYIGEYFRALSAEGLVIVLLEDLHWADDSSLNLVNHLENIVTGRPVLIVGTARPSLFERLPYRDEEPPFRTRLDLGPLPRSASQQLVEEILRKVDPLPPVFLNLVVNTAEGNPFYMEELVKMLIEDGVILKEGERWQVEEHRQGGLRVPPTLMGVLQARVDSLEPQQRSYLQRGAVVGRVFWDQAVEALAASSAGLQEHTGSASTAEVFERLISREMIFRREKSSFENTAEYLFKHALLRDVTYSSLLKRERRVYHGLAARWLEEVTGRNQRSGEFTTLIAEHYEMAGETGQAAQWYLRAGQAAAARYANSEALRAFTRALQLYPDPDPYWVFSVLLEREKVYELLGKRDEQLSDLDAMQAAADDSGDPFRIATAALRRAQFSYHTADYSAAIEHAQRADALAERIQDLKLAAQSLLLQAGILMRQGDFDLSEQYAQRALALATQQDLPDIQAEGSRHLGLIAYYLGNHPHARQHFAQALELFERAGNRSGEALAINNLGGAAFDAGEYEQAKTYYARSLQLCHEISDRLGEGRALNNLGIVAVTQAAYDQAEEYYLQALQISRELGHRSFEMSTLDNLGNLALYRYNYGLAEKYQLESLEGAREIGDRVGESFALVNLSRVYLLRGDYERAQDFNQECLEIYHQLGDRQGTCHALINLCQCVAMLGEVQFALAHGEQALALAVELELRSEQSWALHQMGLILNDLDRFREAADLFRQALEIRQELAETREVIGTLAGLGNAYLGLGELQQAVECVEAILAHTSAKGVEGFDGPVKVFLSCYQVLSAAQDPRAVEVLYHGYALLQEIALQIEPEAMRRSFLERVPENRALVAAYQEASRTR